MRWSTINRIKSQLDPTSRVRSDSGGPLAKHADLGLFKHKTRSLKEPYINQKSIFFNLFFSLQPFSLSLPIKCSLLSLKRFKRILEFSESDHRFLTSDEAEIPESTKAPENLRFVNLSTPLTEFPT